MKYFTAKSFKRIELKTMILVISIFLFCVLIFAGTFMYFSTGKPKLFTDEMGNQISGSISEKVFIPINGVEQGMFIKGKDSTKPVLLFLHGGLPTYFLTERYPTGLEDLFVVCWWDQRGSGLSYSPKVEHETITLEQLLADTKAVTNYLRQRFGQQKIYLMGHSGGTFIGIHAAALFPELYHAYLAVSQMTDQFLSEKFAREFMIGEYQKLGDKRMANKLESVRIDRNITAKYLALRDEAMHGLGIGTTRDMNSVITGVFLESLKNREYTLVEKIKLWQGKASSGVHLLWKKMIKTDLAKEITSLKIPIYFFHGKYDYTTNYNLAKSYFDKLQAPIKRFYSFEKSAHSPMFEEPEKVRQIMELIIL